MRQFDKLRASKIVSAQSEISLKEMAGKLALAAIEPNAPIGAPNSSETLLMRRFPKTRAALGFKVHTAWAALVAVSGTPDHLALHMRRRVELLPANGSIPPHVYHEAAELPLSRAADFVERAQESALRAAGAALADALQELRSNGVQVVCCGLPTGSSEMLEGLDLSAILKVHARVHAAEGILYQRAIIAECADCELPVTATREREMWFLASRAYGIREARIKAAIDGVRKEAGAPWTADQKTAAVAAFIALKA